MKDQEVFVYVLQHVHVINDDEENVKLIGVYSSHDTAHAALERTKLLPGFKDAPDGFTLDKYTIDEDNWTDGYITATVPPWRVGG
jgi:hypothetical protein